jgi:hypothetical protein
MKKYILLTAVGIGFILGSKAGTGPYEKLESTVRDLSRRPEFKKTMETVSNKIDDAEEAMASNVNGTLSGVSL